MLKFSNFPNFESGNEFSNVERQLTKFQKLQTFQKSENYKPNFSRSSLKFLPIKIPKFDYTKEISACQKFLKKINLNMPYKRTALQTVRLYGLILRGIFGKSGHIFHFVWIPYRLVEKCDEGHRYPYILWNAQRLR